MERIVERAHELVGTPYVWGGASAEKGFDCSGLLFYLFETEANTKIPRSTQQLLKTTRMKVAKRNLRKGDAVFFNRNGAGNIGHVGVYIGGGKFIHAPRRGKRVSIASLDNPYWSRSFITARRLTLDGKAGS